MKLRRPHAIGWLPSFRWGEHPNRVENRVERSTNGVGTKPSIVLKLLILGGILQKESEFRLYRNRPKYPGNPKKGGRMEHRRISNSYLRTDRMAVRLGSGWWSEKDQRELRNNSQPNKKP
jgi:hypothetical protein